nr:hypothetical protein [uncultured Kingella sp.]
MRQGGEPQGVQVVRQGEPTPYHCNFNRLYMKGRVGTCCPRVPCSGAA